MKLLREARSNKFHHAIKRKNLVSKVNPRIPKDNGSPSEMVEQKRFANIAGTRERVQLPWER
jgi:hypothetical protein